MLPLCFFPCAFRRPTIGIIENFWSGRADLNGRPLAPQASALTRLRHVPTLARTYHLGHQLSRCFFFTAAWYPLEKSHERAIEQTLAKMPDVPGATPSVVEIRNAHRRNSPFEGGEGGVFDVATAGYPLAPLERGIGSLASKGLGAPPLGRQASCTSRIPRLFILRWRWLRSRPIFWAVSETFQAHSSSLRTRYSRSKLERASLKEDSR